MRRRCWCVLRGRRNLDDALNHPEVINAILPTGWELYSVSLVEPCWWIDLPSCWTCQILRCVDQWLSADRSDTQADSASKIAITWRWENRCKKKVIMVRFHCMCWCNLPSIWVLSTWKVTETAVFDKNGIWTVRVARTTGELLVKGYVWMTRTETEGDIMEEKKRKKTEDGRKKPCGT